LKKNVLPLFINLNFFDAPSIMQYLRMSFFFSGNHTPFRENFRRDRKVFGQMMRFSGSVHETAIKEGA